MLKLHYSRLEVEAHLTECVLSSTFIIGDVKQQPGLSAYQLRYSFEDFAFDVARPKHFRDIDCKE